MNADEETALIEFKEKELCCSGIGYVQLRLILPNNESRG